MRHVRLYASCVGMLAAGITSAQFPMLHTTNQELHTLHTLDVGIRYIQPFNYQALQRTIYNLDLSVHRVLNLPNPPTGTEWGNMSYITDALFDTDPNTIEFLMLAMPNGGGEPSIHVFREDGTQLFVQTPGGIYGGMGLGGTLFQPIYAVDGQTYMLLYEGDGEGSATRIYALPGTLPCMDCFGSPGAISVGIGDGPMMDGSSGVRIYPNPAREQITVALGRQNGGAGMVRLYDGQGRLALERPFAAAEQVVVNVGALAQGTYVCQVFVGGQLLSSLSVVVER